VTERRTTLHEHKGSWPRGVTPTPEFVEARDYIENGSGHLFVTGKAGTGKSTLLRALRDSEDTTTIVVAPTGLAAVQVGGQTIHSFFGLPPRLVKPEDIKSSRKLAIMRKMKTLVIDEVSMVRSDLMEGIDRSLRLNRKKPNVPFGGVRLVLFGDPHQLPPVVQEGELRTYLEDKFGGPFFFDAPGLKESDSRLIELTTVFRQSDGPFLEALNGLREGAPGVNHMELLNGRVQRFHDLPNKDAYVILTPTNQVANEINQSFLAKLPGKDWISEAAITGSYADGAHPTDQALLLKEGAKVILIRNDPDKRWVNGTLARVSELRGDRVFVEIDGEEHEVELTTWESIRYEYDAKQDKIVEQVAGTFKQLPLRLAWALTIHKAQGLTLDHVYIDMGRGAFAHGQAYVALSRCRTLEGLSMARPLTQRDVIFDRAATGYRSVFR
jgi:ATP-dependent DNA helicase PIF1